LSTINYFLCKNYIHMAKKQYRDQLTFSQTPSCEPISKPVKFSVIHKLSKVQQVSGM